MRVLFLVPTTAGPILLRKLARRAGLPAACAFAEGDYRPLPWSADFARLIGPGGPLASLVADEPGAGAFELRVAGSFDAGRSWEAPVALTHVLVARGARLVSTPEAAERIVFCTGALDLDRGVIAAEYHLEAKLAGLRPILDAAPGAALDLFLPPGAVPPEAIALRAGRAGETRVITRLEDALVGFPPFRPPVPDTDAQSRPAGQAEPAPPARARPGLGIALFLAVISAAGAIGYLQWRAVRPGGSPAPIVNTAPMPPVVDAPPAMVAPPFALMEWRAPAGATCRQVLFGAVAARSVAVPVEGQDFAPSRLDGALCGLFVQRTPDHPGRITFPPELLAMTLPAPGGPDAANGRFFRENTRQNLDYALQWEGEGPEGRIIRAFRHAIRGASP